MAAEDEKKRPQHRPQNGGNGGNSARRDPGGEDRLDSLRERLYSRGGTVPPRERRELSRDQKEVREEWQRQQEATRSQPERPQSQQHAHSTPQHTQESPVQRSAGGYNEDKQKAGAVRTPTPETDPAPTAPMAKSTKRRRYIRSRLIAGGVLFFALALILSSTLLFWGQNTISGDNITIDVNGPFVIGGGEELNLQISISNQNAVPIESATLIVEYPDGTQAVDETGRELFRERRSLELIRPGEVLNIPTKAVIFGEENEEKTVLVSVEYRVRGSNATFYKEAEPLNFKISSSPVAISVNSLKQISSGQEVELTVTVGSNSPNPISNILVEAEYPFGFDFSESNLTPVSGQNVWRVDSLDPEEEKEIIIRGILVGDEEGERTFNFRVGVPNERDAFDLASVFSTASTEILIEESFIALDVTVEGSRESTVAVPRDGDVDVEIGFTNTLSNTIYDVEITIALEGNVLDPDEVRALGGFFDSNTNTINWNSRDLSSLGEMTPGETFERSFNFEASNDDVRTPQISFSVSVDGKRVSEDRVPQRLTNSVSRNVKFESEIDLDTYAVYSTGPFVNTGPIQPVAEEISQYTIVLSAENGSNDITDAVVTATLPSYVTWLDLVTAGDTMTYNASTREIKWTIGDIDARDEDEVAFQISVLPSQSQVNTIPTIVREQQLRATDRYTGTVLRASAPSLTTKLSEDPDEDGHKGVVLAN